MRWFQSLVACLVKPTRQVRKVTAARLGVEHLDERCLPSAVALAPATISPLDFTHRHPGLVAHPSASSESPNSASPDGTYTVRFYGYD